MELTQTITVTKQVKPIFKVTSLRVNTLLWALRDTDMEYRDNDFYFGIGLYVDNKKINEITIEYSNFSPERNTYQLVIWVGMDMMEEKIYTAEVQLSDDGIRTYIYEILKHIKLNEKEQLEIQDLWVKILHHIYNNMFLVG